MATESTRNISVDSRKQSRYHGRRKWRNAQLIYSYYINDNTTFTHITNNAETNIAPLYHLENPDTNIIVEHINNENPTKGYNLRGMITVPSQECQTKKTTTYNENTCSPGIVKSDECNQNLIKTWQTGTRLIIVK